MTKRKQPYVQFYVDDWMGGTRTMSWPHKGAYMELLMVQANQGHMSLEEIQVVLGADFETLWGRVLSRKFKQDPKGLYYNEKMENVLAERQAYIDSRLKNLTPHKGDTYGSSIREPHSGDGDGDRVKKGKKSPEKKGKPAKCLFKNSGVGAKDILQAFQKTDDLRNADTLHYFNRLKDASEGSGLMYVDWIATGRAWARRDAKDGKLKTRFATGGKVNTPQVEQLLKTDYNDPKYQRSGKAETVKDILGSDGPKQTE